MANRFNQVQQDGYVSSYVPLPLNEIAGLAKDYQDRFEIGMNKPKELDLLSEKIQAAPIHYQLKDQYINDYRKEINDLVSNTPTEKYASRDFQMKVDSIMNRAKSDPRYNTIIGTKQWWDKEYQPYLNNKDNKKNLNLTHLQDEKGNWKQMNEGVYSNDFIQYKENSKDLKTIMDDVNVDGKSLSSLGKYNKDNNYFLDTDGHQRQITEGKIRSIANANAENYANTEGGGFRFANILNTIGLDPHMTYTDFKYNDRIPKEVKQAVDQELANDLFNYGKKQVFRDTEMSYNLKNDVVALKGAIAAEEGKVNTGQVVPGSTEYNLTEDAPASIKGHLNFNDGKVNVNFAPGIFDSVYEVRTLDGKVQVFNNSVDAHKAAGKTGAITQKKAQGMTDQQHKDLYNFVNNAAKAINWKKPIKADDYNEILTEYNKASKAVTYDYKLRGNEQAVVKDDMLKDRRNYVYRDADGKIITDAEELGKITDPKTFSPDTRIYKDGKSMISFTYKDKDGNLKSGTAQNNAIEDNNFHKVVANIQNDALHFFKTGKVNKNSEKIIDQFNTTYGFNKTSYKGPKAISVHPSPTGRKMYVVLGDKDNRAEYGYEELTLDNNGNIIAREPLPNLPTMMKLINHDWYDTNEGRAEALRIATKTDQYKELLDEE